MTKRRTDRELLKDAISRLERAASYLVCMKSHHYGGNIRADLERVLAALKAADPAVPVEPPR
jgi:hypothetical protein